MSETQEDYSDPIEAARERARKDRDYAAGMDLLAGVMGQRPESMDGRRIDNLPSIP